MLKDPWGIEQSADGNLIVVDLGTWAIYRVDLSSGDRSTISSKDIGTGDKLRLPRNVAIVPGVEPRTDPQAPIILTAAAATVLFALAFAAFHWRRSARTENPT